MNIIEWWAERFVCLISGHVWLTMYGPRRRACIYCGKSRDA